MSAYFYQATIIFTPANYIFMKFFSLLLTLLSLQLAAQECKVKSSALEGSYEGGCQKGIANGQGTARGTDSYTGYFKNGLPHGKGKYEWANGDWYEGQWEKGTRTGYGTMHQAGKPAYDTLSGFWKKDKYIGKYKEPFIVHSRTGAIRDLDIDRDKTSTLNEITISVESITGGARQISGGVIAKPKITSIEIINGQFMQQYDQELNVKKTMTTLRVVQFPFRARYIIGSEILELEILEAGKWDVEVKLLQ